MATPSPTEDYDWAQRSFGGSRLSNQAYGGSAGAGYRRQQEAYTRALRQLRMASRRGDTGAALQEIRVRDEAMDRGYEGGFIRDRAGSQAGIMGRIAARDQAARDRKAAEDAERKRIEESGLEGAPETAPPIRDTVGPGREVPPESFEWGERAPGTPTTPESFLRDLDAVQDARRDLQLGSTLGTDRTGGTLLSTTYGKAGRGTPVSRSRLLQRRGLV